MYANGEGVPGGRSGGGESGTGPAAEQGLARAQLNLGFMYANGRGVPEDDREAVKWYRAAAEQGHASAQGALGDLYYLGRGVPEDYVKSLCLAESVRRTRRRGRREVSGTQIREEMTRAQVSEGQKLANDLFKRIESARSE